MKYKKDNKHPILRVRKEIPRPRITFKDKSKYSRKVKHKSAV